MANAGLLPHGIPFQGFRVTPKIGTGATLLDVKLEASLEEWQLQLLQQTLEEDSKDEGEIKKLLENVLAEVENVDSTGALDVLSLSAQTLQDRIDRIKRHCQQVYFDYIRQPTKQKVGLKILLTSIKPPSWIELFRMKAARSRMRFKASDWKPLSHT